MYCRSHFAWKINFCFSQDILKFAHTSSLSLKRKHWWKGNFLHKNKIILNFWFPQSHCLCEFWPPNTQRNHTQNVCEYSISKQLQPSSRVNVHRAQHRRCVNASPFRKWTQTQPSQHTYESHQPDCIDMVDSLHTMITIWQFVHPYRKHTYTHIETHDGEIDIQTSHVIFLCKYRSSAQIKLLLFQCALAVKAKSIGCDNC